MLHTGFVSTTAFLALGHQLTVHSILLYLQVRPRALDGPPIHQVSVAIAAVFHELS